MNQVSTLTVNLFNKLSFEGQLNIKKHCDTEARPSLQSYTLPLFQVKPLKIHVTDLQTNDRFYNNI